MHSATSGPARCMNIAVTKANPSITLDQSFPHLTLSVGTLLGLYSGLFITENQLLSIDRTKSLKDRPGVVDRKYLRADEISLFQSIDAQVRNQMKTKEQAYDDLKKHFDQLH